MSDIYFVGRRQFGHLGTCVYHPDHPERVILNRLPIDFPVNPYLIDGCLLGAAMEPGPDGEAVLLHFRGWTILSFWDASSYTPEARKFASPMDLASSFVLRGTVDFAMAVRRSRAAFPEIWARFTFTIREKRRVSPGENRHERNNRKKGRLRLGDSYGGGMCSGYRTREMGPRRG